MSADAQIINLDLTSLLGPTSSSSSHITICGGISGLQ